MDESNQDYGWGNVAMCKSYVAIFCNFMDELMKRGIDAPAASQTAMDFLASFITVNPNQGNSSTLTELIFTPEE